MCLKISGMKKGLLFFVLLSICFSLIGQNDQICRLGFKFQISTSKNWGYGKPVIFSVDASSPDETAQFKPDDIIESVDGTSTNGLSIEEVYTLLLNENQNITLLITNLKEKNKKVVFTKKCSTPNSIDEEELASAYVFYSLENNGVRSFYCPFKTTVTEEKDLGHYKTFGFSPVDPNNKKLEEYINSQIKNCLESKGLKYDAKEPDLLIQTYYDYAKNPNYLSAEDPRNFPTEFRYDVYSKKMLNFPIYYTSLVRENLVPYHINFGIKIIDRYSSVLLWECEAKENLSAPYKLDDYAYFHIPLMLMQYPNPKSTTLARYVFTQQKYNYTGIGYNIDHINEIVSVDPNSPADIAGIQSGDILEKTDGKKMGKSASTYSSVYKRFIKETLPLRDPSTQYTDASGYASCMYWDKSKYPQIADVFKKNDYLTNFAYLFYFEPFINLSEINIVSFSVKREKEKIGDIKIQPEIQKRMAFEAY